MVCSRAFYIVALSTVPFTAATGISVTKCQAGKTDLVGEATDVFTVQVCNLFGATCYMNQVETATDDCATKALKVEPLQCALFPIMSYKDNDRTDVAKLQTGGGKCSVSCTGTNCKFHGACVSVQCSLGSGTFAGPGMTKTGTSSARADGITNTDAADTFQVNDFASISVSGSKTVLLTRTGNYVGTYVRGGATSGTVDYNYGVLPTIAGNNYGPKACPSATTLRADSAAAATKEELRMCGSTGKWVYFGAANLLMDKSMYAQYSGDSATGLSSTKVKIDDIPFLSGDSAYKSSAAMDDSRAVYLHEGKLSSSSVLMTSETISPAMSSGMVKQEFAGQWRFYTVVFYCDSFARKDLTVCPEANRKMFYVGDPNPAPAFGSTAASVAGGGTPQNDASAATPTPTQTNGASGATPSPTSVSSTTGYKCPTYGTKAGTPTCSGINSESCTTASCCKSPVLCSATNVITGNTRCKTDSSWKFYDLAKTGKSQTSTDAAGDANFRGACCTDCSKATCADWNTVFTLSCASGTGLKGSTVLASTKDCDIPTLDSFRTSCCATNPVLCSATNVLTGNIRCKTDSSWKFYDLAKTGKSQTSTDAAGDANFRGACCTDCSKATCADWDTVFTLSCASGTGLKGSTVLASTKDCDIPTLDSFRTTCCAKNPVLCSATNVITGNTRCKTDSSWKFYDLAKIGKSQTSTDAAGDADFRGACCTDCSKATCTDWNTVLTLSCASGTVLKGSTVLASTKDCDIPTLDSFRSACCAPLMKCKDYVDSDASDASGCGLVSQRVAAAITIVGVFVAVC